VSIVRSFSRRTALAAAGSTAALALTGTPSSAAPAGDLLPTGRQYRIATRKQSLVVAEVGAELRSWNVDGREMFITHPVHEMGDSHMGKILLPWVDRIDGGDYTFGGVQYETPISEHWSNCALHGLALFLPWTPIHQERDRLVLGCVLYPQYGYPFTLSFRTEYVLDRTGLRVTLTAVNAGRQAAPFGSGYHPYFRVDPKVDGAKLTVAASTYLLANDRGIPIGAATVTGTPWDFRTAKPVGNAVLDLAYTDLVRRTTDSTLAEVEAPDGHRVQLWADENHKFLAVYSDDWAEGRPARGGVAIEPVTSAGNAFNSGDGLIVLQPGQAYRGSWGLRSNLL
jgi:aldose 1-epimerase